MRIELSIVGANGCRDVAIVGDAAARLGGVLGELAVLAGGGAGDPAWCGTRLVSDRDQLAECGMYTGSTLSFVPPHHRPTPVGVRSLALVGGAQAGQVVALGRGPLSIGRAPGCDVVLDDDRASRMHASLDVARSTLLLRDLGSTNGTTVDGAPVPASGAEVRLDEIVRIGDSLLSVAGAEIASALVTPSPDGLLVNRAPRQRPPAARGPIAGPSRAGAREQPRRFQWITALLPAIGGVAIAILLHAPQFLLFALLSPVMLLSGAWGDRVHWRRSRRRAEADYRRARAVADAQIRAGLVSETSARRTGSPDPPTVLRIAQAPAVRLWERSRADADWLIVRVGSADLPSLLQTQSGSAVTPAGVVTSVPVHVDLRAGPLGVAGPGDTAAGIARWIVAPLAVFPSPLDLEFVLLLDPGADGRWGWAR
ncbi:MAG: FHA domain-containing protein, partial [Jatrophihabitans sp.]